MLRYRPARQNKDRHDKERRVAHDTRCPRFCADEIQYGEGAGTINLGKERKCQLLIGFGAL
mgnify:CR=1 FL=1